MKSPSLCHAGQLNQTVDIDAFFKEERLSRNFGLMSKWKVKELLRFYKGVKHALRRTFFQSELSYVQIPGKGHFRYSLKFSNSDSTYLFFVSSLKTPDKKRFNAVERMLHDFMDVLTAHVTVDILPLSDVCYDMPSSGIDADNYKPTAFNQETWDLIKLVTNLEALPPMKRNQLFLLQQKENGEHGRCHERFIGEFGAVSHTVTVKRLFRDMDAISYGFIYQHK